MYEKELSAAMASKDVNRAYQYLASGLVKKVYAPDFLKAMQMQNVALVREFLKFPTIISAVEDDPRRVLHYAMSKNNLENFKILLELPFIQKILFTFSQELLTTAIDNKQSEIIDYLFMLGFSQVHLDADEPSSKNLLSNYQSGHSVLKKRQRLADDETDKMEIDSGINSVFTPNKRQRY